MTLLSLTKARARLSNDRSPTLRLAPSLSTMVSNVNRDFVVTFLLMTDSFTVFNVISSASVDVRVDSGAIRCARRSASYNLASSNSEKGSKLLRIVPEFASARTIYCTNVTPPENSSGSCGMMEIIDRRSSSGSVEMSMLAPISKRTREGCQLAHPSMMIAPLESSTMR